jgi:succinoglycan biosynthesis protein ExoM
MAKRCFASLKGQSASGVRTRVIVVDNDPEGSARAAFNEVFAADEADYLICAEPGIPFARNAALDAARTRGAAYVVYIDDDEVAPPVWLESLFAALRTSGADALQGGVRKMASAEELEAEASKPVPLEAAAKAVEAIATCNTLFKAALLEPPYALRFDEGMRYTGGSDRDFFMRAHQAGAKVMKTDGAYVVEEIAAGRETLAYECSRAYAAGANYTHRMIKNEPAVRAGARILFRMLERGIVGLVKLIGAFLLFALMQGKRARKQLRKGGANVSFAAGAFAALIGVRGQPYKVIQGA